jgi:hypothetical protein
VTTLRVHVGGGSEKLGVATGIHWHMDPGNRIEYIDAEAQKLHVDNPVRDTRAFQSVQARLKGMSPAPSTEDATRSAGHRPVGTSGDTRPPSGRVDPPAAEFRTYDEGGRFRVSVPTNWRELPAGSAVTFAPDGGYGTANGQSVFTHGIEIGEARNESHDLDRATGEMIDSLAQGNPQLRRSSASERMSIGGLPARRTLLSNVSEATGAHETIELFTTVLPDGSLLYAVAVAPSNAFPSYRDIFDKIIASVNLRI